MGTGHGSLPPEALQGLSKRDRAMMGGIQEKEAETDREAQGLFGMSDEDFDKARDLSLMKDERWKLTSGGQPSRALASINPDVREHYSNISMLEGLLEDPDNIRLMDKFNEGKALLSPRYPDRPSHATGEEAGDYESRVFAIEQNRLDRFKGLSPADQSKWLQREMVIRDGSYRRLNQLRKELGADVQAKIFVAMAKERANLQVTRWEDSSGNPRPSTLDITPAEKLLESVVKVYDRLRKAGSADALVAMPFEEFAKDWQKQDLEKARMEGDKQREDGLTEYFKQEQARIVRVARMLE